MTTPPRVVVLASRDAGMVLWRVSAPARLLAARGYPVAWAYADEANRGDVARQIAAAELLVLVEHPWHNLSQTAVARTLDTYRRAGIAVAGDYGDDLTRGLDDYVAGVAATLRRPVAVAPRDHRVGCLGLLDGLTAATPALASRLRDHTGRPVCVVSNRIDLTWWRAQQAGVRRAAAGPTIGWAGTVRPPGDLDTLAAAWSRIAARYPAVRFAATTWEGDQPLARAVPAARFRALPFAGAEAHARALATFDVGCCPLPDTAWNRGKSPMKAFEYAVSGAAVVASPLLYGEVIAHGASGYLAETADEWEAALARLIEDEAHRQDVAAALLATVEQDWSLERHAGAWVEAWRAIVADARQAGRVSV